MSTHSTPISLRYIWARIHSLMGLGIVIFLIEHLITNSQAALMFGQDGIGFIRMVNLLHSVPYLQVVEVCLIAVPILYHAIYGIYVALLGRYNNFHSDGSRPVMLKGRNHAYTWQRITSWILLLGIGLHVFYMRFWNYPIEAQNDGAKYYLTRVEMDSGLYTVCDRLGVKLYNASAIAGEKNALAALASKMSLVGQKQSEMNQHRSADAPTEYDSETASVYNSLQRFKNMQAWVDALQSRPIDKFQVIAVAPDFGTATLLNVRNAFKSPVKSVLYSIFVAAAVFHAFNGLWTFLITWGAIIKMGTQRQFTRICLGLMLIFGFLGLMAVWGSYWINLRS